MTQHLVVPDRPLLCCKSSQWRAITCDSRLEPDDLSPQSACARLDQRLLEFGSDCEKSDVADVMETGMLPIICRQATVTEE